MKGESVSNFIKCSSHPSNYLTYLWIYDLNLYQIPASWEPKHVCTCMFVDAVLVRQLVRLNSKAGGFQSLFSRFLKERKSSLCSFFPFVRCFVSSVGELCHCEYPPLGLHEITFVKKITQQQEMQTSCISCLL